MVAATIFGKMVAATILVLLLATPAMAANVKGEEVTYEAGGLTMKGYLAYDDQVKEKRPGVLVVHEWWGQNDYVRNRARMLAELGYTALALDMYGEGKVATHPKDARLFAGMVMMNMDAAQQRFMAALELLKKHPTTDPDRVAAIGYCFGGGVILAMARSGVDLDAVVSFHGSLATNTPAEPGKVKARVLVCHGADDQYVTKEQIDAFREEMKKANVDLTFNTYDGAKHAFTNPDADANAEKFDIPIGYNAEADRKSWVDMQEFFTRIFKE
jgi:dienelactone hydrolase